MLSWSKINELSSRKMMMEPIDEDILKACEKECIEYIQIKINYVKNSKRMLDWSWYDQFIFICDRIEKGLEFELPEKQKKGIAEIRKFMQSVFENHKYMQSQI